MVYCVYRSCRNHCRSQSWDIINKKIFFIRVPLCKRDPIKCKKWIEAINRDDITVESVKRYHHVCSKHFIGGNGPTAENPDPVPDSYAEIPLKLKSLSGALEHSYSLVTKARRVQNVAITYSIPVKVDADENQEMCEKFQSSGKNECVLDNLQSITVDNAVLETKNATILTNSTAVYVKVEADENQQKYEEIQSRSSETSENVLSNFETGTFLKGGNVEFEELQSKLHETDENVPVKLETFALAKDVMEKRTLLPDVGITKDELKKIKLEVSSSASSLIVSPSPVPNLSSDVYLQNLSYIINLPATSNKLEEITRNYLIYQASNLRKMAWCLNLKSNVNFDDTNFSLVFKKSLSKKLFLRLIISSSLKVMLRPFNKELPDHHKIFSCDGLKFDEPLSSLQDLLKLFTEIDLWKLCRGISGEVNTKFKSMFLKSSYYYRKNQSVRSNNCHLLFKSRITSLCQQCRMSKIYIQQRFNRKKQNTFKFNIGTNMGYLTKDVMLKRMKLMKIKVKSLRQKMKAMERSPFKNQNKF